MNPVSSLFKIISIGFCILILADSCDSKKSDPAPLPITSGNIDSILFVQSSAANQGYLPYQNKDTIRQSSSASAHSPYFKVRLNAIARSVLDVNGKLPVGKKFPEGSIIVKDLYNLPNGPRQLVAIMKKESANPYAKEGWLWNELLDNGGGYVTVKDKGAACTSCHSSNSRDFVRTFDLF